MTRVLIADDHPVVREGVRRILQAAAEIEVVGEVGRADEVSEAARRLKPDVVLLDIAMPGPGFTEVLAEIPRAHPGARVLILSAHSEEEYAVVAMRAGAAGYLSKGYAPDELTGAVRRVARGSLYVSPSLAEHLALGLVAPVGTPRHQNLSGREFEVFRLVAQGRSLKEIAARMGVSPKTVSSFRARVLAKLELKTNADLVRYALEHKLA